MTPLDRMAAKIPNTREMALRAVSKVAPEAKDIILNYEDSEWVLSFTLGNYFFNLSATTPIELGAEVHRVYDVYTRGKELFPDVFGMPNTFDHLRKLMAEFRPEASNVRFYQKHIPGHGYGWGVVYTLFLRQEGREVTVTMPPYDKDGVVDFFCDHVSQILEQEVSGKLKWISSTEVILG